MERPVYMFDLDGTLIDSMPHFSRTILSPLDDAGMAYPPELIKTLTALGYEGSARYYVEQMGLDTTVEELVTLIRARMYDAYANVITLKEGVGDYLRAIHAAGARLFVLTASPHLVTDACMKHNGIWALFEQVWSVEDFGLNKSDTRIFCEAAARCGVAVGDVHYFDDNVLAIRNSTAAGMDTFAVRDRQDEADLAILRATGKHFVESFCDLEVL